MPPFLFWCQKKKREVGHNYNNNNNNTKNNNNICWRIRKIIDTTHSLLQTTRDISRFTTSRAWRQGDFMLGGAPSATYCQVGRPLLHMLHPASLSSVLSSARSFDKDKAFENCRYFQIAVLTYLYRGIKETREKRNVQLHFQFCSEYRTNIFCEYSA